MNAKPSVTPVKTELEVGKADPIFVEICENNRTFKNNLVLNETYIDRNTGQRCYGKRGINIPLETLPALLYTIAQIYQQATGMPLVMPNEFLNFFVSNENES